MAKIKSKWFDKFFASKTNNTNNEVYEKTTTSKTYFSNVVPPINKNVSDFKSINISSSNDNNIYEAKNVQVTSSYIIPLQEKKQVKSEFINQNNNYYDNQTSFNTRALISFKNSFKIPKPISREIKIEKLKHLLLFFLSAMVLVVSAVFIAFFYQATNRQFVPHPIITIPLLIVTLTIALINIIEFVSLCREVDLYIERTLKGSLLPPHFIISNYRKIHVNLIILNWISISCYVVLSIAIGIMTLISGQKLTFIVQSWTVVVAKLTKDIISLTIILGFIFIIHMINIILFKFRKRNIMSYYGYEIISEQELSQYKKKINRVCMFIVFGFLALLFFAIVIPIWILKRRNKKT